MSLDGMSLPGWYTNGSAEIVFTEAALVGRIKLNSDY